MTAIMDYQSALNQAYRILSFRSVTVAEMRNKLLKKGFNSETIEKIISSLQENKYLDDNYFTQRWIEERNARGYSKKRILHELISRKKIPPSVARKHIQQIGEEEEERKALMVAEKSKSRGKNRTQIAQFLARNGFPYELIDRVLRITFEAKD